MKAVTVSEKRLHMLVKGEPFVLSTPVTSAPLVVGEVVRVREAWRLFVEGWTSGVLYADGRKTVPRYHAGDAPNPFTASDALMKAAADPRIGAELRYEGHNAKCNNRTWRPAYQMPEWASRYHLRVDATRALVGAYVVTPIEVIRNSHGDGTYPTRASDRRAAQVAKQIRTRLCRREGPTQAVEVIRALVLQRDHKLRARIDQNVLLKAFTAFFDVRRVQPQEAWNLLKTNVFDRAPEWSGFPALDMALHNVRRDWRTAKDRAARQAWASAFADLAIALYRR